MATQPVQQQNAGNGNSPNFIMDHLGKGLGSAMDLLIWKGLSDLNDGDLPMTYDPFGGVGLGKTETMGGAALSSVWKATDMFWIAGGAVIVLGIYFARK